MQTESSYPRWRKGISYITLMIVPVIVLGLLATSYVASLVIFLGVLSAWPTKLIFKYMVRLVRKIDTKYLLIFAIALLQIICTGFLFFSGLFMWAGIEYPAVKKYKVTVELQDSSTFNIQEAVVPIEFYATITDEH